VGRRRTRASPSRPSTVIAPERDLSVTALDRVAWRERLEGARFRSFFLARSFIMNGSVPVIFLYNLRLI
jgi:hypothetical protein